MDWKRKLTSRKFWTAVGEFVTMLIIALGGSQETAVQVTALIMAGAAVVAYIIGEGLVDAANAGISTAKYNAEVQAAETQPPDEGNG